MAKKKKTRKSASTAVADEPPVSFHPRNMRTFYAWDGDVLVLNVLGTPSAKKDAIGKPKGNQLKISVTADPVGGRATDYMVRWLAREFQVGKNDIEVVFGRMNVNKQFRIARPGKLPKAIDRVERQKSKSG